MEIERKFAGRMASDFTTIFGDVELHSIEQFYTYIGRKNETRYRMTREKATKTVKTGEGLTRDESETQLESGEYEDARKNMVGNYIEKERLKIPYKHLTIEIDVYSRPRPDGWAIIEVEFGSEDEAKSFSLPPEITRAFTKIIDVTEDSRFKNKSIALIGFPSFMEGL